MSIHAWEAVCFFILVLLIAKPVKRLISDFLDNYSNSVKKNLDDSTKIRLEAEESAEYYSQKQKEFAKIIEEINENSEYSINKIHQDAEKELEKKIEKKKLLHEQSISIKKAKYLRDIQLAITKKSFEIVKKYLEEHKDQEIKENLDQTLEQIKTESIKIVKHENQ